MRIHEILRNAKLTGKEHEPTHTCMAGGSYYVTSSMFDDFMDSYTEAVEKGVPMHIVERHRYIGPVVIDIDLRQKNGERLYDDLEVTEFVKLIYKELAKLVVVPAESVAYVLEKPEPREGKGGVYKDGIHIVIPDVVTQPSVQYEVRKKILAGILPFDNTAKPYTNTPDDIYDKAVIKTNGESASF